MLGHDAWSCDLYEPPQDGSPWHCYGDAARIAYEGSWDMMIAHPPCTYLTNAGVCHLHTDSNRWQKMQDGANFFKTLLDAPIPRKAIENPIMHKYAVDIIGRRQDQVIQPWMFGHTEQKATCLWLYNLPLLLETNNVKDEMMKLPKHQRERVHYMSPSADRWKLRSTTYLGIANAMAEQWGNLNG